MLDCSSHIWGTSHDRERYICINCEAPPGSKEAQEVCLATLSGSCEEDEESVIITNWDKPEPSWKDEPTSDYRMA
jgi:hypothetical protein